jgi:hypothetical protein
MDHFAGLDVSVKETSVCIVDDTGRIVRETKVVLTDVADSILVISVRGDDGARAIGTTDDDGAGRAQPATGSRRQRSPNSAALTWCVPADTAEVPGSICDRNPVPSISADHLPASRRHRAKCARS